METEEIPSDFKSEKNELNEEIKKVKYLRERRKTLDKSL